MNPTVLVNLPLIAGFCAMQVIAVMLFKLGSLPAGNWTLCFIIANIISVASAWPLMRIYGALSPNIANGIAVGGSFALCQLALFIFFRTPISPLQFGGIALVCLGVFLFCT